MASAGSSSSSLAPILFPAFSAANALRCWQKAARSIGF
jgi:hypothetical protein